MRVLSMSLIFVAALLVVAILGRTETLPNPPGTIFQTPEEGVRYLPLQSALFMEVTTSVPFDGGTTPSGIIIFTSPTEPPFGFEAGELYLFVDSVRGWELK